MWVGGGNDSPHCTLLLQGRQHPAGGRIVRRDAIGSAHRALGSSGTGSSRFRQPEHLSFPIAGRSEYESHRERAARRGKERIRAAEARVAAEMAVAEAADAEEATRARIMKNRPRRNTRAVAQEQNQAVRAMAGLPPKEEKEDCDGEDSSSDEQIRLDPYCVFDRYFREKDGKSPGKGKGKAAVDELHHSQTCQILIVRWHV